MADTNITIEGLGAVEEHLTKLSREASRKIARNALRKGGEAMREAVTASAARLERSPYRGPNTSALPLGALKSDIRKGATTDEDGNPSEWIGPGKYTAHVARFVEYGHRQVKGGQSRLLKSGKTRGPGREAAAPAPAYPFIRPAYEATAERCVEIMADSLIADVEKSADGSAVADAPEVA
jgi:HK97 gp10 family phage protein